MEDIAVSKPTSPMAPVTSIVKPKATTRVNRNEPETEPKERMACKSKIQNQVDPNKILTKLLETPITLAVGEVLGISKKMTHYLQEAIKVKTTKPAVSEAKVTNVMQANRST